MKTECPTCGGSGVVDDDRMPLAGEYCPVDLELPHGGKLTCLVKGRGYHDGEPHETSDSICTTCGGIDLHTETCPMIDTDDPVEYLEIRFDDDGWYWVEPLVG